VLQTLAHCDGNRTHAARVLGVSVRTMRNKIRQYAADGCGGPAHASA
jgi:DNA-binding protein Fis